MRGNGKKRRKETREDVIEDEIARLAPDHCHNSGGVELGWGRGCSVTDGWDVKGERVASLVRGMRRERGEGVLSLIRGM